jgi:DNA-directed RNA polymerase specialized sigma24 family protein
LCEVDGLISCGIETGTDGSVELIETIQSHDPENDPEHQAAREEARAKFRRAFERLSPREREREVAVLLTCRT